MEDIIGLYVKAVEVAKEKPGLSNQEQMILNRFKILLLNGSFGEADQEIAQYGKIKRSTIHKLRELAESLYEDWIRNSEIIDSERDHMIKERENRANMAEESILEICRLHGLIIDD